MNKTNHQATFHSLEKKNCILGEPVKTLMDDEDLQTNAEQTLLNHYNFIEL